MSNVRTVWVSGLFVAAASVSGVGVLGGGAVAQSTQANVDAYPGVIPGTDHEPAIKAPPGAKPTRITWPGFQVLPGGGARVFVQATGVLPTEFSSNGNTIRIPLGKARLAHSNNGRPLDTHFFNTAVARVYVKISRKQQATLVIELTRQSTPVLSLHKDANGYQLLHVDFAG